MARPSIPYRKSDPKKLAQEQADIMNDVQRIRQSQTETNTYAPVSPPEQGLKVKRPKPKRVITNLGIVTSIKDRNNPV